MSTAGKNLVIATISAISAIGFGLSQRARSQKDAAELTALRQNRAALAAQLVRAEQQIAQLAAPVPTPTAPAQETPPPTPPVASLAAPVAASAAATSAPTLAATKELLATLTSAAGRVSLDSGHTTNIRTWIEQDPLALIQWLATLPTPRQMEHSTEAVIAIAIEPNPEFAFLLANSITREMPRFNRISSVVFAWAPRDPVAATKAVTSADLPENSRQLLLQWIERAKSSAAAAR